VSAFPRNWEVQLGAPPQHPNIPPGPSASKSPNASKRWASKQIAAMKSNINLVDMLSRPPKLDFIEREADIQTRIEDALHKDFRNIWTNNYPIKVVVDLIVDKCSGVFFPEEGESSHSSLDILDVFAMTIARLVCAQVLFYIGSCITDVCNQGTQPDRSVS
jgi:hypothetical protein